MNLHLAAAAFAALAALAVPSLAYPTPESPERPAITALYARMAAAMKAKDVNTIASMATPDFTERETNGKVYTAKDAVAEMNKHFKSVKKVNAATMTLKSLKVAGKTATAVVDFRVASVTVQGGKPHDFVVTGTTRDTLVKTAQGWRFRSVQAIKNEAIMDGQKVSGPPPAASLPTRPARPIRTR